MRSKEGTHEDLRTLTKAVVLTIVVSLLAGIAHADLRGMVPPI